MIAALTTQATNMHIIAHTSRTLFYKCGCRNKN